MGEIKYAFTISNSQGKCSEEHSRRSYIPFSAEKSIAKNNIVIYDCGDDRKHLNDTARPYIKKYNAKQKRNDRKKDYEDDYASAVDDGRACYGKGDKKEKAFHLDVIQIGNRDELGITDKDFDVKVWRKYKLEGREKEAADYVNNHINQDPKVNEAISILREVAEEIAHGKYSNILVHGLVIHADEPNGTPHLDFRYSVFIDNEKMGVPWRVSDHKGLAKMGFETKTKKGDGQNGPEIYTALQKFRESINERIEEKMIEHGWERKYLHEHRKHLSVAQFEAEPTLAEAEVKSKEMLDEAEDLYDEYMEAIEVEKRRLEKEKNEFVKLRTNLAGFLSSNIGSVAYREYAQTQRENAVMDIELGGKKKRKGKIALPRPELQQELEHIDRKLVATNFSDEVFEFDEDEFDELGEDERGDTYEGD